MRVSAICCLQECDTPFPTCDGKVFAVPTAGQGYRPRLGANVPHRHLDGGQQLWFCATYRVCAEHTDQPARETTGLSFADRCHAFILPSACLAVVVYSWRLTRRLVPAVGATTPRCDYIPCGTAPVTQYLWILVTDGVPMRTGVHQRAAALSKRLGSIESSITVWAGVL